MHTNTTSLYLLLISILILLHIKCTRKIAKREKSYQFIQISMMHFDLYLKHIYYITHIPKEKLLTALVWLLLKYTVASHLYIWIYESNGNGETFHSDFLFFERIRDCYECMYIYFSFRDLRFSCNKFWLGFL